MRSRLDPEKNDDGAVAGSGSGPDNGGAGMHGHARARVESQKLSVVFGPNATYSEILNGRIRIQLNLAISQMRISGCCV